MAATQTVAFATRRKVMQAVDLTVEERLEIEKQEFELMERIDQERIKLRDLKQVLKKLIQRRRELFAGRRQMQLRLDERDAA